MTIMTAGNVLAGRRVFLRVDVWRIVSSQLRVGDEVMCFAQLLFLAHNYIDFSIVVPYCI